SAVREDAAVAPEQPVAAPARDRLTTGEWCVQPDVARIAEEPRVAERVDDGVLRHVPVSGTGGRSGNLRRVRDACTRHAALDERLRVHLDDAQALAVGRGPDQLAARAVVTTELLPQRRHSRPSPR